jgi:predicted nuclease with TOPRIM domain
MQRRQPPPKFMGEPSPSLAKLRRMRPPEIRQHIARLVTERERLTQKIERLQAITPPRTDDIKTLTASAERLAALEREAQNRLDAMSRR